MKAPSAASRAALLVEAGEDRLALGRQRRQVDQHGDHAALDLVLVVVHCPGPKLPFQPIKRPARPYKSATQKKYLRWQALRLLKRPGGRARTELEGPADALGVHRVGLVARAVDRDADQPRDALAHQVENGCRRRTLGGSEAAPPSL